MVAAATPTKLGGLARMLVQEKLLSEHEAESVQAQANSQSVPFVTQLVQSRKLSAIEIAQSAANAFGFPLLDLNSINSDYLPQKAIDAKLMQNYRVMALLMGCLHTLHNRRANRCAEMSITEDAMLNRATPIFIKRESVPGASLVCSVESTM